MHCSNVTVLIARAAPVAQLSSRILGSSLRAHHRVSINRSGKLAVCKWQRWRINGISASKKRGKKKSVGAVVRRKRGSGGSSRAANVINGSGVIKMA